MFLYISIQKKGFTSASIISEHHAFASSLPSTERIPSLLNNFDPPSPSSSPMETGWDGKKNQQNKIEYTHTLVHHLYLKFSPDKMSSTYKASNHLLANKDTHYLLNQIKRYLVYLHSKVNAICSIFHVFVTSH